MIVMEMGSTMTGVTWTGEVIRNNYELELEGMRLDGSDFFCTTTFPVGKDPCSLVVGGWGGSVVGLSSIDYADASENATTKSMAFKDKKWYPVRIRVSDAAIEAWIGDEKMVDQPRKDHKIGIRMECELCRPLGISTWCTGRSAISASALKPEEVRHRQRGRRKSDSDVRRHRPPADKHVGSRPRRVSWEEYYVYQRKNPHRRHRRERPGRADGRRPRVDPKRPSPRGRRAHAGLAAGDEGRTADRGRRPRRDAAANRRGRRPSAWSCWPRAIRCSTAWPATSATSWAKTASRSCRTSAACSWPSPG